jgi:TonB family protein
VYTAEATALHLEGVVSVKIRVSASGSVQIIGVTNGLGHGLDQSAERAVLGMHFKPAMDAQGNPVDWEGVVNITFQMAG